MKLGIKHVYDQTKGLDRWCKQKLFVMQLLIKKPNKPENKTTNHWTTEKWNFTICNSH